ncbi:MAG: TonB-dependent receptor [Opitutales bacterium]
MTLKTVPGNNTQSTNNKALQINLRPEVYGTFAEIGAGQEVARNFFKVGGAAGTVAKSMSAYDMVFSDSIYGKSERYVSRGRLMQMLEHEFTLLRERLMAQRGASTRFFVFANTVAARGYKQTDKRESHGWMGVRLQLNPMGDPNDIILHVRMLDKTNAAQQDALGLLGVNLIYAAFNFIESPAEFVKSLLDEVGPERVEVDILSFYGPGFQAFDNRLIALQLVEHHLTSAVMFGPGEEVLLPSEELRKKPVLVERGTFRPIANVNVDMLRSAGAMFVQEPQVLGKEVFVVLEITMKNLLREGHIDPQDFLARVDAIHALDYPVMVSNYPEYFRLSAYFRRYTSEMLGMVLGINNLLEIFNDKYYEHLEGGILESCGRLFKEAVKLYAYPMKGEGFNRYLAEGDGSLSDQVAVQRFAREVVISAENLQVKRHLRHLYAFLLENHFIEPVVGYDPEQLNTLSRDILGKIRAGDLSWKDGVPPAVVARIEERGLWKAAAMAG